MYAMPRTVIVSDAELEYYNQFGDYPGILVIAGTGSIALCIDKTRKVHRCGGYGPNVSDEGSGYWLGLEAIKHVLAIGDVRVKSSQLGELISSQYNFDLDVDARSFAIRMQSGNLKVSDLAPLVFQSAALGCRTSRALLAGAAEHLFKLGLPLLQNFGRVKVPIVFHGSVATHPMIQKKLKAFVKAHPRFVWQDATQVNARGALSVLQNRVNTANNVQVK
jgi:N-acetylglucosamine kinase-like BadF-type ATPase